MSYLHFKIPFFIEHAKMMVVAKRNDAFLKIFE
jgi:hypothetical protein